MKNSTLAIRAVYAAFARVLCAIPASFLNFKGGGGAEMNARTMTISRVCGGILAVFFALSFAAENANAQTAASCERSRVYTPSDDSYGIPTRTLTWNINGTLRDIAAEIRGFPFFFNSHLYFLFGENPDRVSSRSDGYGSGTRPLPQIADGSRDARQGDIITIQDLNDPPAFSKAYRVYLNTASAVALADGQETEILKCEEHLVATRNEFFLDSGWSQTATAASGNSGHDTLTCPTGMVIPANPPAEGDNSACVMATSAPNCDGTTAQLNAAMNACDCITSGDVLNTDGLSCFTPPNCDGTTAQLNGAMNACECITSGDVLNTNGLSCFTPPNCDGTTAQLNGAMNACECITSGDTLNPGGLSCSASSQTPTPPNCDGTTAQLNDAMDACECITSGDTLNPDRLSCSASSQTPTPPNCDGTTAQLNDAMDACECITSGDTLNPDELSCSASSQTPAAPARTESDVQDNAIVGLGGAAAVGVAAYFLSGGNFGLFAATPDFGYSLTESGYSINAGGRVDFRKNRWHLYWTAGQQSVNGDFGDFRYSSGGEYKADFWTAAFSEKVQGDVVDYDVSLSANYGESVWQISPVYRLHSRFEEEEDGGLESETTNSLNLEGVLRYHRWTVRPSAGFQWREMDDFADNARFGISAVRNL